VKPIAIAAALAAAAMASGCAASLPLQASPYAPQHYDFAGAAEMRRLIDATVETEYEKNLGTAGGL